MLCVCVSCRIGFDPAKQHFFYNQLFFNEGKSMNKFQ